MMVMMMAALPSDMDASEDEGQLHVYIVLW